MTDLRTDSICKFCCGCGLCDGYAKGDINAQGFYRPSTNTLSSNFDFSLCYFNSFNDIKPNMLWGYVESAFYGYSCDKNIRYNSSSGGVLTEISKFLLDHSLVDSIITVKKSDKSFIKTTPTSFSSSADAVQFSGSKYTASSSLMNIINKIDLSKRYAVIGKPCDIRVLRNFLNAHEEYNNSILYLLSFFCGGTPSRQANLRLLNSMGLEEDLLRSFRYRGHGWPGKTSGEQADGHSSEVEYETSWGSILGRDIQEICRFCWEGVGEAADISCGDGWYLDNNKPSFKEGDGRNIVLSRNEKGTNLLLQMKDQGYIHLEELADLNCLEYIQPGQFMRKASMFSRVLAMKLFNKKTPDYKLSQLFPYSRLISFKDNVKMFGGTVKRILDHRIQ